MMFIVHLSIINGLRELKTTENDYIRTLHEGNLQGLRCCFQVVPDTGFAMYNFISAGFLSFARGPEYGFLTIKLYGLVAN